MSVESKIGELLEFDFLSPESSEGVKNFTDFVTKNWNNLGDWAHRTDQKVLGFNTNVRDTYNSLRDIWNPGEAYISPNEPTGDAGPNTLLMNGGGSNTANLPTDDYENYYNPVTKSYMNDTYSQNAVTKLSTPAVPQDGMHNPDPKLQALIDADRQVPAKNSSESSR